jgi:hypothetical protein
VTSKKGYNYLLQLLYEALGQGHSDTYEFLQVGWGKIEASGRGGRSLAANLDDTQNFVHGNHRHRHDFLNDLLFFRGLPAWFFGLAAHVNHFKKAGMARASEAVYDLWTLAVGGADC